MKLLSLVLFMGGLLIGTNAFAQNEWESPVKPRGEARDVVVPQAETPVAAQEDVKRADVPARDGKSDGLLPPAVQQSLEQKASTLWRCRYQVALESHTRVRSVAAGDVMVRFYLMPDGSVTESSVVSIDPTNPNVLQCATEKVDAWTFDIAPSKRILVRQRVALVAPPQEERELRQR